MSSSPISVFTTQTPSQPNFTDGPGVDWELGMRFVSDNTGLIQAIRYFKPASETGTHIGRVWSSTGQQLASITFTNETASGWQQQTLATPLAINAGTSYVVSVNANSYYSVTSNGFGTAISNRGLTAPIGAGIYNDAIGAFPGLVYQNENYFRDVVFTPGSSLALRDNATIFASETAGTAAITVVRSGSTSGPMTLEYTANEVGGAAAAQAGSDFTTPTFDGRANTGQIVFADGESSKTFSIPIVNDQNAEGNETFSVGIQIPARAAPSERHAPCWSRSSTMIPRRRSPSAIRSSRCRREHPPRLSRFSAAEASRRQPPWCSRLTTARQSPAQTLPVRRGS